MIEPDMPLIKISSRKGIKYIVQNIAVWFRKK